MYIEKYIISVYYIVWCLASHVSGKKQTSNFDRSTNVLHITISHFISDTTTPPTTPKTKLLFAPDISWTSHNSINPSLFSVLKILSNFICLVIQVVTCSSPIVGGHLPFQEVTFSPLIPKGSPAELPGDGVLCGVCVFSTSKALRGVEASRETEPKTSMMQNIPEYRRPGYPKFTTLDIQTPPEKVFRPLKHLLRRYLDV